MPRKINDEEVFAVVCDLLVESGYQGMTTKVIADRASINEVTLFRKYGSKSELVCLALKRTFAAVELAQVEYSGNLESDILSIVVKYMGTVEKYGPLMQQQLFELPRYPELMEGMASIRENIGQIVAVLERYRNEKRLNGKDGRQLMAILIAPLGQIASFDPDLVGGVVEMPDSGDYTARFLKGYGL